MSVAVLADVHGNVPALRAVLAEPDVASAELIVFCGDITWGPEPEETARILMGLGGRALFTRGNADRAVVELASGERKPQRPREEWMLARHSAEAVRWLASYPLNIVWEVENLGTVRFGHGSPRGDTELITPGTPERRMAQIAATMPERVLVSGHTHLQFDRVVAGLRSINPGSVGLPYHDDEPQYAFWALFDDEVRLRRTRYDVAEAVARCRASGDPSADVICGMLTKPPSVAEIIEHAESREFSD